MGRAVTERLGGDGPQVVAVDPATAPGGLEPLDVVVNLADCSPTLVRAWAGAGSAAGGYLDIAPTEATHRALDGVVLGPAPVLPGAGFVSVIGDALAVMASARLVEPTRADVTVYVPSRRSLLAGATPRERGALLDALLVPMSVLVDGEVADERIAEDRRLAWFPRPVGPHHAAAVPGPHWRTLPRVVPTLRTIRTALALRSSSAEVLQGLGNAARFDWVADRIRRRAASPGRDRGTAAERWAIVVEVATPGGRLVRGWAYGHDRHALTAESTGLLAGRVATADASVAGVPRGATEVMPAESLLDALAARTDLRWSVTATASA